MSHVYFQSLEKAYEHIDNIALVNTAKVLKSMQKFRVSDSHFAGTTGYGYNDVGRDILDAIFADVFEAEDALVRVQFVNGTHAISCALRAVTQAGENPSYISLVGKPYDTLQGIMPFKHIDVTSDGSPDFEEIKKAVSDNKPRAVLIQRSRGYSTRKSLSIDVIKTLIDLVKDLSPETYVLVDNCYGEFVEELEPTAVGADLIAGSLIKNPGGGLAVTGGYVAGKKHLVEKAAEALTVPGIGRECGSSLGQNRLLYQGFFMAPHIVAQAVKTAVFAAAEMERRGYAVSPPSLEKRSDIIQSINFDDRVKLIKFVQGIQASSPVDAFAVPEPWAMPGYDDEVIMAAGTFIQGSSIELSCDAPMREPYCAYLQGGLTFEAGRLSIQAALRNAGIID